MATCPECDAEIEVTEDDIEELEVGDPVDCGECGSQLRVSLLAPLEFDLDDDDDDDVVTVGAGSAGESEDDDSDDEDDDAGDSDWDD